MSGKQTIQKKVKINITIFFLLNIFFVVVIEIKFLKGKCHYHLCNGIIGKVSKSIKMEIFSGNSFKKKIECIKLLVESIHSCHSENISFNGNFNLSNIFINVKKNLSKNTFFHYSVTNY